MSVEVKVACILISQDPAKVEPTLGGVIAC